MSYPFSIIEMKWQNYWEKNAIFSVDMDVEKPKYYVLDMFPYPSAEGLHVGHPEGYTASDIIARYKRMKGFHVLHPMGWDAFGLPAERYAMKTKIHPRETTKKNIANFRRQCKSLGFSYDWNREINTTEPEYYKWTQWIFLKILNSFYDPDLKKARPIDELPIPEDLAENSLKRRDYINSHRLAYTKEAPVNWSPELKTVLANEELQEWVQKGYTVEKKQMKQWMLRITAYAERLLEGLEDLDWPSGTIELQKNWIGRSEGVLIDFFLSSQNEVSIPKESLRVFTTRPDTLFGVSYLLLAPEHPLALTLTQSKQSSKVLEYIQKTSRRSEQDRMIEGEKREKTGVFTGGYVFHPFTREKLPVWIADYILMGYGTGAVMAVPAHDRRDFDFAKKFLLPIRSVIQPLASRKAPENLPKDEQKIEEQVYEGEVYEGEVYEGEGVCIHSDFLNGLNTQDASAKAIEKLEEKRLGKRKIQYKLRDWLFSRQRYWGEPIPVSMDEKGNFFFPKDEELVDSLPLRLPEIESFEPAENGESPLARAEDWLFHPSSDGGMLRRETNTMPQWAGSCWYYLRFLDPKNKQCLFNPKKESYWMGSQGVDLYIGGAEHAVLHLLYARFWHKILYDLGFVTTPEPFARLVHQGLILGEDGKKMSKSLGNTVNPDETTSQYGADSLRLYEMFLGPLEQNKPWVSRGIEGVSRFLNRVWRLYIQERDIEENILGEKIKDRSVNHSVKEKPYRIDPLLLETPSKERKERLDFLLHSTIQKIERDIEKLSLNTAISCLMTFVREVYQEKRVGRSVAESFVLLLSPFAPHIAEELWSLLGKKDSLAYQPWPDYDPSKIVVRETEVVFQVNGKLRGKSSVPMGLSREKLEEIALKNSKVQNFLQGKKIQKVITVPNRLVNIVAHPNQ